jgi:hypothetical protein
VQVIRAQPALGAEWIGQERGQRGVLLDLRMKSIGGISHQSTSPAASAAAAVR